MRHLSAEARARLTEPWEECVLYVYDDKVPKRRVGGVLKYPEWDGGEVRGTLTVGIGHTDAAGPILVDGLPEKIEQGLRITRAQADEIFEHDIAPCERRADTMLTKDATAHQFDMICDLDFNCPSALAHVCRLANAGDWKAAERVMLQYDYSRGARMAGLVHRRNAEIAWGNTPDDPEEAAATVICPKGERAPPPKPMGASKSGSAALTIGAGGIAAAVQSANQAAAPIEEAKQHLVDLGLFGQLSNAAHSPLFWIGLAIVALAGFVFWDRRQKLMNDHV